MFQIVHAEFTNAHMFILLYAFAFTIVAMLAVLFSSDYGQAASLAHTFVDDVFGGHLASTVKCMECQTVSVAAYMCLYHVVLDDTASASTPMGLICLY